jgi:hypothetical protein
VGSTVSVHVQNGIDDVNCVGSRTQGHRRRPAIHRISLHVEMELVGTEVIRDHTLDSEHQNPFTVRCGASVLPLTGFGTARTSRKEKAYF